MNVVEQIFEHRLREIVEIDTLQFGFMPGKGTTDATVMARSRQECYGDKNRKLFMCFVDWKKPLIEFHML